MQKWERKLCSFGIGQPRLGRFDSIPHLATLPLTDIQLRLRRFSHMPMPTPSKSAPVSFFRSLMGTKRVC